jgi:integrase
MPIEKLQLQVITADDNLSDITVWNSKFTDDSWDLSVFINSNTTKSSRKKLDFSYIKSSDMKLTAKYYAYHKLGQIKPQSIIDRINIHLRAFIEYCDLKYINSFSEVTQEVFLKFVQWLKEEKKVAPLTGYQYSHVVEEIIKIGQIKGWNVPKNNIFTYENSMTLWQPHSEHKERKTKPIPEYIFDKILYHAVNDEKDILTKSGIIIQSQTGLRINEVLGITEGCIHTTSDGYDYMVVLIHKTDDDPEPVPHKVFINDLVKKTVSELEEYTKEWRLESGLKELFLNKHMGKINVLGTIKWADYRLPKFIERWGIRDKKGRLYHLSSHQFRATFVRELIKKKVPIAFIKKHYGHVSLEMTAHYLTLQEEEVKEIYSEMILGPDSKIAGLRAGEIKGKLNEQFKGKTEDEIDDLVSDLASTMGFNPLPTGVCLYDFRRGNCENGDGCFFYNCPNYVTEAKFYPILKQELDLMEKEMARYKALGRERDWQRQEVKYRYLKPLVESLEVQINGKET